MTVSNAAYHYTLSDAARALLPRHAAWWQHRGSLYVAHETGPLQSLWLPLSDGTLAHEDLDLTPDMLDLERITGAALDADLLDVDGDTLQYRVPYGVVPWVEAIMGCPIRATFQSGSMRSGHIVRDWDDWKHAAKWVDAWADALVALTRMLVERSGGCYAIAQTLMRGPSDLAEAALGPEFMCTSMYDHPDELRAFLRDICDVFMHVLRIQMEHWPRVEGGYVSWWGIWAPGTVVRTQCDASAFLSPRQYAEWFLPCDVRLCEAVDYGIIHLHSGSLHTVDALLQVDKPQVIQVSLDPEPSGPPYVSLLPAFEKILLGGKSLIIDGAMTAEEVRLSEERLPADGRFICVRNTWTLR